jgi:hypothetical protein
VSGSPEVDQGLKKVLKCVSFGCSQAHNQSSNVVKKSKDKNQSIANKSMFISQKTDSHQTVQSEELNTTVLRREVEVLFLAQSVNSLLIPRLRSYLGKR